jgi:8-oxo-dGTP pyrophosphatase MutT (NUDIX family)
VKILSEISDTLYLMFRRPKRAQYAALCYRLHENGGGPDILLLTSRDTGRWVIPKGWPMGVRPGYEVAAQEALEEAGVIGEAERQPVGCFGYDKVMPEGVKMPCEVQVHALKVTDYAEEYKEKGKRRIEWVSAGEAAARVHEPGLKKLIQDFALRVG